MFEREGLAASVTNAWAMELVPGKSIVARVVDVGRSSMTVQVELIAEDLHSGERKLCTRGHFVMVALDAEGCKATVPALPASASVVDTQ